MNCPHCLAEVSEGTRFCNKCGKPLGPANPRDPVHSTETLKSTPAPSKRSNSRLLALCLVGLFVIIAAAWIVYNQLGKPRVQLVQSGPILKVPPAIAFRGGTGGSEAGSSRVGKASQEEIGAAKKDVQAHPNDPKILNDAGCLLQDSDEKQVGFDLLAEAHQLAPEDPIITYNYARSLYSQGKADEATQQAQAALQRKPDLDQAHILLADMATQRKDYDAADQQLKNLANVMKEIKVAALTIQAAILMGKGKLQEAYQMFQQALALDQQDPTSLYNAGLGSQMLGNFPQAQSYYQQALQLEPNLAEAHNNLGTVLMLLGHAQQALQQLQAAVSADPGNKTFLANISATESAVGTHGLTASNTAPFQSKGDLDGNWQFDQCHISDLLGDENEKNFEKSGTVGSRWRAIANPPPSRCVLVFRWRSDGGYEWTMPNRNYNGVQNFSPCVCPDCMLQERTSGTYSGIWSTGDAGSGRFAIPNYGGPVRQVPLTGESLRVNLLLSNGELHGEVYSDRTYNHEFRDQYTCTFLGGRRFVSQGQ